MTERATHVFLPPIAKTTGGVQVLLRLAVALRAAGYAVRLVPREPPAVPLPGFAAGLPLVPWEGLALSPEDIWLVPEGWPNALAPGLAAGARCLVYVQNWAYLFSSLPPGLDWRRLPVSFLAVSAPVAWFVRQCLGMEAPVLRPGIDSALFAPPEAKPAGPPWRIAYMPRKNRALAEQVMAILAARRPGKNDVAWLTVERMTPAEVARTLASAHLFLATGFPEGCPLPPLEAMACGCLPVGFSGFGGFDYMRQAAEFPGAARPWWPIEPKDFGGNGLWAADADPLGAALGLETALGWLESGAPELAGALDAARATAAAYDLTAQARAAAELWAGLRAR
jgi:hypothetical protein